MCQIHKKFEHVQQKIIDLNTFMFSLLLKDFISNFIFVTYLCAVGHLDVAC